MLTVEFHRPLTALEIREPLKNACDVAAREFDLYAVFCQWQQQALTGNSFQPRHARHRIGNGKHKAWFVKFQHEHPGTSERKVTSAGRLAIKSHFDPSAKQYGGFDYGSGSKDPAPTYNFITITTTAEEGGWRAVEPNEAMLKMAYEGIIEYFKFGQERLFDSSVYIPEETIRLTS